MKTNTPLQNLVGRVADRLSPRGDSSAPAEKSPRPLVIESLEPRIMFSGSPAPAPAPAPESSPAEAPAVQESTAGTAPEAASPVPEDSAVAAPPAGAESAPSDAGWGDTAITLTDTELAALTETASMIWAASGISGEQASALASARYQIADLGGRVLGSAEGDLITIDDDAAGRGWFVDGTPEEDSEFAPGGTATTGVDLLSAVLHEQGHLLGLEDSSVDRADIMFELIGPGERRLPVAGEAAGAIAGSLEGAHMLTLAPATEDFEDEASGSSVFSDDGNPGGPEFTLAVGADQSPGAIFETFKDGSGYGTGGSNGLLDTFVPGNTLEGGEVGTITIESGWSFEVNSIDVAVADSAGTPGGSETVIFTGTVAGGSTTVTESIVVDSSASDWNTVDFTGTNFEDVQLTDLKVSLPASPSAAFLFFDDFNYTADDGATPPPPPPPSDSILAVDFNSGGSPTEAGFVGQSAASFTHTTAEGDLTVVISDQQGNFDRGVPATHGTHTDIYRDFFFDDTDQLTLTLSGAAISANTDYDITFYAFDEAQNSAITFTGVSGTSGSAGPISSTADADITSLDQFAAVGTFTSDGSGVLTIDSSTTMPRINGFEIDATPPPPPPPDGGGLIDAVDDDYTESDPIYEDTVLNIGAPGVFSNDDLEGNGSLTGQLGILDLSANGGINPATGNPWELGDEYRLVFVTSTRTTGDGDIAFYNDFVQTHADASSLGLGSVSWSAIASTASVNALANTGTDPAGGIGESIWLTNGTEIVADNYADMWDGNHSSAEAIDRTENNTAPPTWAEGWGRWSGTWTGTNGTGATSNPLGDGGNANIGLANGAASAAQWVARSNGPEFDADNDNDLNLVYGISEVLKISVDPAKLSAFDAVSANGATVNVNPDGSFSYDPTRAAAIQALDAGESLTDTFTYTISDVGTEIFTDSFENPDITGQPAQVPTGWSRDGANGGMADRAQSTDGAQHIWANGPSAGGPTTFHITLGEEIIEGTTYTLTVDVFQTDNFTGSEGTIRLFGSDAGFGTALVEQAGIAPPQNGALLDQTVTFTATAAQATGQMLGIALVGSGGTQVRFDNVRLTESELSDTATVSIKVNGITTSVVNVASVTGHDGGNFPTTWGHLSDMINALSDPGTGGQGHNTGIDTSAVPTDPSTWTYAANSWHQEWLANSRLNPLTSANLKIGWAAFDFGSVVADLENMYLWNISDGQSTENTDTYNVYYADSPTANLPATPNSQQTTGDYDFASGGWTLLNDGGPLTLPQQSTANTLPQAIVDLGGISARYIAIEILSAGDPAGSRVGLAQVEFRTSTKEFPAVLDAVDDEASTDVYTVLNISPGNDTLDVPSGGYSVFDNDSGVARLGGELGILDLSANGGINPATGNPWEEGDTYRLAFVTSGQRDATSSAMADYDAFVQAAADASSLGLDGATWQALGTTVGLNSREYTGMTDPLGGSIFLVDGTTQVANNYNDFWDGSLDAPMSTDENGTVITGGVWAGMLADGSAESTRHLGSAFPEADTQIRASHGDASRSDAGWALSSNALTSANLRFYAMSEELTITVSGGTGTITAFDAVSANGATVNLNPDGSFSYDPTGAAAIQALHAGETLTDTFTYTISEPSDVRTSFDEASLDPNVKLDVPNPSLGNITFDADNDELDFSASGNTDMWTARNNAPIAWVDRPTVAPGDTWAIETEVRINNIAQNVQQAGITFYADVDGSRPDFIFGLDNWVPTDRKIHLQGLGDNVPTVTAAWAGDSVFLRVEVTENGGTDTYNFFYKETAGDAWIQLGGGATDFQSGFDNSRAGLFYKTAGAKDGVAFTELNVIANVDITPATDTATVSVKVSGVDEAFNEALLRVDFDESGSPTTTETGFRSFDEAQRDSVVDFSGITVAVSGEQQGVVGGFHDLDPVADGGAFTYGELYTDYVLTNDGAPISFDIGGLDANTDYEITWFSFQSFSDASEVVNQFEARSGSSTTGDTVQVTYNPSVAPTTNDQYSVTGTWTSTASGTLEIDAIFVSDDWGGGSILRVNGFEIYEVAPPDPINAVEDDYTTTNPTDEDTVLNISAPGVLANDTAGPSNPGGLITGVTVEDFSSELASLGRLAVDTINGDGMTGGTHDANADNMWEVQGTFQGGTDTAPWHLTLDLENNYDLDTIHVWNYNEAANLNAGARDVEIWVSPTDNVGDLIKLDNAGVDFVFAQASGTNTYTGFDVDLSGVTNASALEGVRLVRFNILSSYGSAAELVGLSEVQFTSVPKSGLTISASDTTSANGATVNVNPDGSFDYDPTGSASIQALDAGDALTDTFTYTVADGFGNTDTATVSIAVDGLNDAPVLAGANDFDTVSEDDTANGGQMVSEIAGGFITDADGGSVEGIAITGATSSSAAGTWQFSTDGGGSWADVGAVSETSGLLLRDSDLVRYLPDGTGVANGSITFKAWDQTGSTSGGEGTKVTTLPDGSTEPSSAFSADTATSGAEVTEAAEANSAPVLTGANDFDPVSVDDATNMGQPVVELVGDAFGDFITDADTGAVEGIAITGATSSSAAGTFQFSTDGGGVWTDVGAVSETSGLLLRDSDLVRYLPDGTGVAAGSITFKAWDQTGGTSGGEGTKVTTLPDGSTEPSSAFSADTATSGAEVVEAVDADVFVGGGTLTYREVAGRSDVVTIYSDGTNLIIHDDAGPVTAENPSWQVDANTVSVPLSDFEDILFEANDLDDTITVGDMPGFDGSLTIDGGEGFDTVTFAGGMTLALGTGTQNGTDENLDVDAETVKIDLEASLSVVGGGTIDITAAGGGAEDFVGIHLRGASLSSEGGAITLEGEGGSSGNHNDGVQLSHGSSITTGGGSVSITGTATGVAGPNDGVSLVGGSDITVGGAGTITITGTSSGVNDSYGVLLLTGTELTSGAGEVSVTGSSASTGPRNSGVYTNGATVTSAGGSITLDGSGGGSGGGGDNKGLRLTATTIGAGGSGGVTLTGTGGSGTSTNVGVEVGVRTEVTTASGDIVITGTGGAGTGVRNRGAEFQSDSRVISGGSLTIAGTSGGGTAGNEGVYGLGATLETTGSGALAIVGTGGGSADQNTGVSLGRTAVAGAGDVSIRGTGSVVSSGRYNDGVSLTTVGVTAGGDLLVVGDGGTGGDNNRGVYGNRVTIEAASYEILGRAHAATTGGGNAGVSFSNSTFSDTGTISGTGGGGTGPGNYGVYLHNVSSGMPVGNATGTAEDEDEETGGNYFNVVLPALVLAAGADRVGRKRRGQLAGLIGRLGESAAGEGEMEIYRESDGVIGLEATLATVASLEAAGVGVPDPSGEARRILVLTGDGGVFARLDAAGKLLSASPLARGPAAGAAGLIESLGGGGRGGWSQSPRATTPVPGRSFSEVFGIE